MDKIPWDSDRDRNPHVMLHLLSPRASARKLRLFSAACCRRVQHLMTDPRQHEAIEAAERFADGRMSDAEFAAVFQPIFDWWEDRSAPPGNQPEISRSINAALRHLDSEGGTDCAAGFAIQALMQSMPCQNDEDRRAVKWAEQDAQCAIVRDLFRAPCEPFRFDTAWLARKGKPAVELAQVIYRDYRFDLLPTLADVLQRAGIRDDWVLTHCRTEGPHVRGCWVVDALLEKESAIRLGLLTESAWQTCADPAPLLQFLTDKGSYRKWRLFAVACCRLIDPLITDERSHHALEVVGKYADGSATDDELQAARIAVQEAHEEVIRVVDADGFPITPISAGFHSRQAAAFAVCSALDHDPRPTGCTGPKSYRISSNEFVNEAIRMDALAKYGNDPGDTEFLRNSSAAETAWRAVRSVQCDLLRDIFGEYLGPLSEEGEWLTWEPASGGNGTTQQWCLLPTPRTISLTQGPQSWRTCKAIQIAQHIYDKEEFESLPILADCLEDGGVSDIEILAHLRGPGPHVRGCWALDAFLGKS